MEETLRPRRMASFLHEWLRERVGDGEADATPLDILVEQLGLDTAIFHPESRRGGTLGWLEPDEDLVYLRDGLPEPIRRFTLAHELGHALLHRARPLRGLFGPSSAADVGAYSGEEAQDCVESDFESFSEGLGAGEEVLRPGEAYSARARRESEANSFAAELLLPATRLRAVYLAAIAAEGVNGGARAIRRVARVFGVSEEVVLRRLTALLTPDGADELPTLGGASGRVVGLDEGQEAAARSETPALVIAGPGTGKTSTLVGRVAHLVRERDIAPERILALTFSNKAAREMRERLSALLDVDKAGDANVPGAFALRPLPTVATIHAFCGDLLRRYAPLVGLRPDFRLVTGTEAYLLLRGLVADLDLRQYESLAEPGFHFPALLSAISRAKDELAGPEAYAEAARVSVERAATPEEEIAAMRAEEVARVYMVYQAALAQRGDVDFGDVIRLAVKLLREQTEVLDEVRARYAQILVDEFQDINRAMGVLLHTLAGEAGPLWAVGDADQAIYRFRGASPANLALFASEYRDARIHTLRRNYRSVSPILDAAAGVAQTFLGARSGEPLEAVRPAATGTAVFMATATESATELAGLAGEIRQRMAAGRSLAEQAVLCRTRKHAQQVATALNAEGIPARLAAPLLDQELVKNLLGVFSLLAESTGAGLLRAGRLPDHAFAVADAQALLATARAQRQTPLATLRQGAEGVDGIEPAGRAGMVKLADVLDALRAAPDVATALTRYSFGLTSLGGRLLTGIGSGDEVASAQAAQLAELLQLARGFDDIQKTSHAVGVPGGRGGSRLWTDFFDYLRIVGRLRQEPGRGSDDIGYAREAVRVLTVHASKGLEFPVVYLPGLADRRFPTQRRGESAPLPPALSERAEGALDEGDVHVLEEACLFYVAVTRARDELVLSVAERYGRMRYKPSAFLAPIEQRLGLALGRLSWAGAPHGESDDRTDVDEAERPFTQAAAAYSGVERSGQRSLRSSEVETYARCPRQYAYRYVYELRPHEIGMFTLRGVLQETLQELVRRSSGAHAAEVGEVDSSDVDTVATPSLDEAFRLFEAKWEEALARELLPVESDAAHEPVERVTPPFEALYRRHGRGIVERLWGQLAAPAADAHSEDEGAASRPGLKTPDFERGVSVQVGGRAISVTLDRVEVLANHVAAASETAGRATGRTTASPAVYIRHRLGRSSAPQADMRALFYALAAEQAVGEGPATLLQYNLSTDELAPAALSARQRSRLTDELHDALDGIARGDFAAKPEPGACDRCPFLLICPA